MNTSHPLTNHRYHSPSRFLQVLTILFALCVPGMIHAQRQPHPIPDLTQSGKPTPMANKTDKILIINLGPTGLLGWVYHFRTDTSKSRQILVTSVMPGSPADGVLQEGDVILGVSGSGAKPENFTSDARKSFALAIGEAEARTPATLAMSVWRAGKTLTTSLTLETMGAYSATAPYDCPKTMRILEKALPYIDKQETKKANFGINILGLLACNDDRFPGNAERMKRAEEWIIELLPDRKLLDEMTGDRVETYSKTAWVRTYTLLVMAEYYLATGNNPSKDGIDLLSAIDAHAQTIARGQSMFGTMGHQFAMQGTDGSIHGPYAVGYGPINAVGLIAFIGLNLASECELPDPKTRAAIDAGIERARQFFRFYVDRGSIPYGEHPPYASHGSNGKNGMAAIAFSRMKGSEKEAKYFSQISIAAAPHRDGGHGGAFFNYLWMPLGSAVGGQQAAAANFKQISWHLDLARTWEGGFYYTDYANPGYNGERFGKANMDMSTPALLTYAQGLHKITLTGRKWRDANQLSPSEIAAAVEAADYAPQDRSLEELTTDLGSFSVMVRNQAATEFAGRPEAAAARPKLETMVADPQHPSRLGAIKALGLMGHPESAPVLFDLLDDPQALAREAAIDAIASMPQEIKEKQVDTLLKAAAALKRPPMEVNPQDPVNSTLVALNLILFEEGGVLAESLQPVEAHSSREQLHEAIRAVATLPSGGQRAKLKYVFELLTRDDVAALGDTLVELIHLEAPADAMFAEGIRSSSVSLLLKHHVIEGVQGSIDLYKVGGWWTKTLMIGEWTQYGPSLAALPQAAEINELLKQHKGKTPDEAQKALAAMSVQGKATIQFVPLK